MPLSYAISFFDRRFCFWKTFLIIVLNIRIVVNSAN